MIPMRDGVKLFTVIWKPKTSDRAGAHRHHSHTLRRGQSPGLTGRPRSLTAAAAVPMPDAPLLEKGYIRVYQDVRGKHGSEGNYVLNSAAAGPP